MAKKTVMEVLLAATKEKTQGKKESAEDFTARLVDAVQGLDEKVYDKLPDETTDWYNKFVKAHNAEKKLPALPGLEVAEEEEEDEEKPAKKGKKSKGNGAAKKAKGKKGKSKKSDEPRVSVSDAVRHIIAKKLSITKEDVMAKLESNKIDYTEGQAGMVYDMSMRMVRVLQETGKL